MTIQELQDAINKRLEKLDGKKYTNKGARPEYHKWYTEEIVEELESRGVDIFRVATWRIVAEIDGPGEVKVSYTEVAKIELSAKRDRRYKHGGPGTILSIRVDFREELRPLTIEEARVFILKADLESRLEYYKKERARLAAELDETAKKIAELTAIEIV
nr:hypothetical protein [uncultured Oscillibacter sp.]